MPEPTTAVLVGGSLLTGGLSNRQARKDRKAADNMDAQAQEQQAERLAWDKERYNDWQETYGSIEDNLADYYDNMTPESYAAQGLEDFQVEHQASNTRIKEILAQRGIQDSGIALATELSSEQEAAETRAGIRADAPGAVRAEQQNFLRTGMGKDPAQAVSNTMGDTAAITRGRASDKHRDASAGYAATGQAISTGITTLGTGLSDYKRGQNV